MFIDHYKNNGFVKVGSIMKNPKDETKKYRVYVKWNDDFSPKKKSGVYIMAYGDVVMKIGESEDIHNRFQCYESHSGPTNTSIRESMVDHKYYEVYFLECPSFEVGFAGVKVQQGISYKSVEKQLLMQYLDENGKLPAWNKGLK